MSDDRCDTTDLLVSSCGCRVHRGAVIARNYLAHVDPFDSAEEDPKGPWIYAQWGGECGTCGSEIRVGYQIRADGFGDYEGKCCA